MKHTDYYAVLGVDRDADEAAIKKAYRKLARQHHPDVSTHAEGEARFKEVAEAYSILKDPEKRTAYDALGAPTPGEEFESRADAAQWFSAGVDGFAGMDPDELLARFRRDRRRGGAPVRGADQEAVVQLSLEEAHRGKTVRLDVKHEDGTRTLAVTVPPGAADGQRLRLRGKGAAGALGGDAGDLYLHVRLLPHPVFRADGHDLVFDLALAPWEAALGGDVEVPTLDGRVLLAVPPGTRSGRKLRLRGRGLATGHGGRGDLYALVRVDVPASLTVRERELFEELGRVSRFDPRAVVEKERS